MGTATVDLLGAYPALVLCPGHMVEKWKREVMEVVPGARGVIVENIAQLQAVIDTYQPGEKLFVVLTLCLRAGRARQLNCRSLRQSARG